MPIPPDVAILVESVGEKERCLHGSRTECVERERCRALRRGHRRALERPAPAHPHRHGGRPAERVDDHPHNLRAGEHLVFGEVRRHQLFRSGDHRVPAGHPTVHSHRPSPPERHRFPGRPGSVLHYGRSRVKKMDAIRPPSADVLFDLHAKGPLAGRRRVAISGNATATIASVLWWPRLHGSGWRCPGFLGSTAGEGIHRPSFCQVLRLPWIGSRRAGYRPRWGQGLRREGQGRGLGALDEVERASPRWRDSSSVVKMLRMACPCPRR
ncbi:hypothetical protein Ga0074812_15010 [Parafrankia irregularis]|uniref:Uncharacterized protein n=1 Tax=Parafrankia irregularis TaxID=795642 RepID=A0A0S4R0P1_9ACTN|nr:hypothetical protein Ga0074812_15010 [Parafrankia irregularis]